MTGTVSSSIISIRPQFYQTRSAWSKDQGSTKKCSAVHNFVPTVTKFCVLWEGLSLPHDTKFGNCRGAIVDRRVIFIWSLILGSSWSCLINVGPGLMMINGAFYEERVLKPSKASGINLYSHHAFMPWSQLIYLSRKSLWHGKQYLFSVFSKGGYSIEWSHRNMGDYHYLKLQTNLSYTGLAE